MDFAIVIPAYNEEETIALTLESLVNQTLPPKLIVVVDDNSTDNTFRIVDNFTHTNSNVRLIRFESDDKPLPGAKIISAFYQGFNMIDVDYDVICKFDADLSFPPNYLEKLKSHFLKDKKNGLVGGFCFVQSGKEWILENAANKDHIRGALKAYKKECFEEIGGLKRSIGWDTVDELLIKYYGWEVKSDQDLHVKHLRPTGSRYQRQFGRLQGKIMYKLRYGFIITLVSALKLLWRKKNINVAIGCIQGYFGAKSNREERLVSEKQGTFIRSLRWKGIRRRLFGS